MKENKSMQLKRSIQKKLMAATSMLMVAVIMMVSSTYAWFTLSTAPEVTGITTAVGANGNLEIALAYVDGSQNINTWENPEQITSAVGDSGNNHSWGNLIDISTESSGINYGLSHIALMPAQLQVQDGAYGPMVGAFYLETPVYGADGRVDSLEASSYTGTYNSNAEAFYVNSDARGVRAIGTASSMTQRQTDYRNARATLSTNGALAQVSASKSLYNNGSALADLILKHATAENGSDTYTETDLNTIKSVVESLNLAVEYVGDALENAIVGYVASAAVQISLDDTVFEAIRTELTLEKVTTADDGATYTISIGEAGTYPLPEEWVAAYNIYLKSLEDLEAAEDGIDACDTAITGGAASLTWAQISVPLTKLVNPSVVTINGYTSSAVKENMSAIVSSVTSNGVQVELPNGSGVYSDVAALTGDYKTSITISEVTYGSLTIENVNATMSTKVIGTDASKNQVPSPYFTVISNELLTLGAPTAGGATSDSKITDFYGYAVDMIFRTNASSSNLLLQSNAIDRIYEENTGASDTMGHGSTMTFTTTDVATFTADQVARLMGAIRVVFMDDAQTILAKAKLNMSETDSLFEKTGTSVTAGLYIYTDAASETQVGTTATETIENVEKGNLANYTDSTTTDTATGNKTVITYTITKADGSAYVEEDPDYTGSYTVVKSTAVYKVTTTDTFKTGNDAVITALTQNTAQNVTVLVYLDGNYVDNTMVGATTTTSMTGTMNLQFASDATLVPMEYTKLYEAGQAAGGDATGGDDTPSQGE